jgi:hypothetical protein
MIQLSSIDDTNDENGSQSVVPDAGSWRILNAKIIKSGHIRMYACAMFTCFGTYQTLNFCLLWYIGVNLVRTFTSSLDRCDHIALKSLALLRATAPLLLSKFKALDVVYLYGLDVIGEGRRGSTLLSICDHGQCSVMSSTSLSSSSSNVAIVNLQKAHLP